MKKYSSKRRKKGKVGYRTPSSFIKRKIKKIEAIKNKKRRNEDNF